MIPELFDWLGQPYTVDDFVLYGPKSKDGGTRLGRVRRILDNGAVLVQQLAEPAWGKNPGADRMDGKSRWVVTKNLTAIRDPELLKVVARFAEPEVTGES